MSVSGLPHRQPHPVRDPAIGAANRARICGPRGFCGPFINEEFYKAYANPIWDGVGDCLVCGNSCRVEVEMEKRRLRTQLRLA